MTTPAYKGNGQPALSRGWLSGISWLGGSTPAYAGPSQPAQGSSGTGPAYKTVPASPTSSTTVDPPVTAIARTDDDCAQPPRIVVFVERDSQQ